MLSAARRSAPRCVRISTGRPTDPKRAGIAQQSRSQEDEIESGDKIVERPMQIEHADQGLQQFDCADHERDDH